MTIAFKSESQKVMIEFPLCKERNFLILNFMLLSEEGNWLYIRKYFEILNHGKKLKILMNQHFLYNEKPIYVLGI